MALTLASVLVDYKASLKDAAGAFTGSDSDPDADFKRHLALAVDALSREKRPRTQLGTLSLVAEQGEYSDVPADLLAPKVPAWGHSGCPVWDLPRGPLPTLRLAESGGSRVLTLTPAPRADQLRAFGSTYRYYYLAQHSLAVGAETLPEDARPLLMLRAQIEAMRELSYRNYNKPVTLRAGAGLGGGVASKNMTPPAIFEMLMAEWREAM